MFDSLSGNLFEGKYLEKNGGELQLFSLDIDEGSSTIYGLGLYSKELTHRPFITMMDDQYRELDSRWLDAEMVESVVGTISLNGGLLIVGNHQNDDQGAVKLLKMDQGLLVTETLILEGCGVAADLIYCWDEVGRLLLLVTNDHGMTLVRIDLDELEVVDRLAIGSVADGVVIDDITYGQGLLVLAGERWGVATFTVWRDLGDRYEWLVSRSHHEVRGSYCRVKITDGMVYLTGYDEVKMDSELTIGNSRYRWIPFVRGYPLGQLSDQGRDPLSEYYFDGFDDAEVPTLEVVDGQVLVGGAHHHESLDRRGFWYGILDHHLNLLNSDLNYCGRASRCNLHQSVYDPVNRCVLYGGDLFIEDRIYGCVLAHRIE